MAVAEWWTGVAHVTGHAHKSIMHAYQHGGMVVAVEESWRWPQQSVGSGCSRVVAVAAAAVSKC